MKNSNECINPSRIFESKKWKFLLYENSVINSKIPTCLEYLSNLRLKTFENWRQKIKFSWNNNALFWALSYFYIFHLWEGQLKVWKKKKIKIFIYSVVFLKLNQMLMATAVIASGLITRGYILTLGVGWRFLPQGSKKQ